MGRFKDFSWKVMICACFAIVVLFCDLTKSICI